MIPYCSEISDSLREEKMRLPFIQRALANVRYKLTWIAEQKVKLKASYKEFTDVQEEMERENQMKVQNLISTFWNTMQQFQTITLTQTVTITF